MAATSVTTAPGPGAVTTTGDPTAQRPRKRSELLSIYLAISPFYIIFAIFGIFPIAYSIYLSFHAWDGIGPMTYVGLEQYRYLLSDTDFWKSLVTTVEIWIISTIPMLFLALVIAFLLNSQIRFKTFYRVAFFIPNITSLVAIAIIFGSIFSNNFGLINAGLKAVGVDQVQWLTAPWGIKVAVAAMVIWRWTGYNAIIYLAGLQAISGDLFEAARVDGASQVQTFFRITIPLLRPVILFTVIMSTIGGLQIFTEPQILVGNTGGPDGGGMTMVLYLYNQAFTQHQFGYGAAIGWALFLILLVASIINWRLVQRPGRS